MFILEQLFVVHCHMNYLFFLDGAFDEDLEIKKQQLKAQKFEEEYKKKKPSKLKPRFVYLTILCDFTKKNLEFNLFIFIQGFWMCLE